MLDKKQRKVAFFNKKIPAKLINLLEFMIYIIA